MLANDLANKIRSLNFESMPKDEAGNQIVRVQYLEPTYPDGVMVMSPLDGLRRSPTMKGWLTGTMQIIVRSQDAMKGYDLAREIAEALTVEGTPVDLENYKLVNFCPLTDPITYPINEAGLIEHSVNFEVHTYRLN